MKKIKTYTFSSKSICWDPGKCQHEGMCLKTILPESAEVEAGKIAVGEPLFESLLVQTTICPSGALKAE